MRLAALVGVKDEEELIGPLIAHLHAHGVERIAVIDVQSRDGTRDVLAAYAGKDLTVHDLADTAGEGAWQALVASIIADINADWLLLGDADEFPLTGDCDLRQALRGAEADVLRLPRYNAVLTAQGLRMRLPVDRDGLDRIDVFAEGLTQARERLASEPALAWIRTVPKHKLAVRPATVATVKSGMHDVIARPGRAPKLATASNILVAHAALTTYARFESKVDNIRQLFRLHDGQLPPEFGWHWRRWLDLADRGLLRQEFDNSSLSETELAALKAQGIVRSAAALLASRDKQA